MAGGSSDSNSSSKTSNVDSRQVNTTNTADYSDRSTNLFDTSNRSTNTTSIDTSNRSVNNIDSSNRSVTNTTNLTTDQGAVAGGLKVAGQAVDTLAGTVNKAIAGANDTTKQGFGYAEDLFGAALDYSGKQGLNAMHAYDAAAQVQTDAVGQIKAAYSDAKGTSDSQQKIMLGVLAVAALFAITSMHRA